MPLAARPSSASAQEDRARDLARAQDGVPRSARAPTAAPRIAWLHSHLLMWAGGTKFVFEVARRVHRSVPVDMIVERAAPEIAAMFSEQGMRVIEIASRSSTSMAYWAAFPLQLAADVRRLRALKAGYTTFTASMFPMSSVALLAGARPLTTYVMEPFAFFHDEEMIAGFPLGKRLLLKGLSASYKWLDVWGVKASDRVLTINAGVAEWVHAIYGREAGTSLLGVDTALFSPERSRFAQRWPGRRVIIHSTDFTPLKRTNAAIDAVAALRGELPSVLLVITCSHDDRAKIDALKAELARRGLAEHVEVLGRVSHEDLPHYYARADASLYTGIGKGASAASLFVLECMACATPGVRTHFTQDEIQHEVSGFLYDPNDEAALQRDLKTLLSDDALRARFGEAARKHVVESYSWDEVAARFLACLLPEGIRSEAGVAT
jgi:glycosyltransferase involved in cell wall biosynthesis